VFLENGADLLCMLDVIQLRLLGGVALQK